MSLATARSVLWFRKGLRLHDNPALHAACRDACHVYPLFVLDPWFLRPDPEAPSPGSSRVGINRIRFLLESLEDLDRSLKAQGSRLILVRGNPAEVLPSLLEEWKVTRLCFESDTEPYALSRDKAVTDAADVAGVEVVTPVSHTIFDPRDVIQKNGGKVPLTYQSFCKLLGKPAVPVGAPPDAIPPPGPLGRGVVTSSSSLDHDVTIPAPTSPKKDNSKASLDNWFEILPGVPSLASLGYSDDTDDVSMTPPPFRGGETEGLRRLGEAMGRKKWVATFEKPKGDPSLFLQPATTVLSPYLKFGCVSSRLMYAQVLGVYAETKTHTKPPVSLEGQLLWREFFYTVGFGTPGFDRMEGSPICRQVAWRDDEEMLARWRDAKTGYPWIDAIMTQLRTWGWMHHLARHCVACFLTRGDLYQHWEKGRDVFDRLLLDADWSINNGNWLWLSASAFFSQYFRIYSPITFGKKYDPTGRFIRQFLPVLKDMPAQYIYEPWKAPLAVQKKANCIIGEDYPSPIVDHAEASKLCKDRMALAYASNRAQAGGPGNSAAANAPGDSEDDTDADVKKGKGKGKGRTRGVKEEAEVKQEPAKSKGGKAKPAGTHAKEAGQSRGGKRQRTITEFTG